MSVGLSRDKFKQLANAQRAHIRQLEELCCDLYYSIFDRNYDEVSTSEHNEFMKRMGELGLLEDEVS